MATNFPASLDDGTSIPNPTALSKTNSPSLSAGQTNRGDAIKATEAKLGTGASTPTNNTFLIGNGTGTSAWSSLTSAQVAARVSDETGSGSLVFATSPTLTTPKADTINEVTPANGVTIDGLNIKDAALTTSNSVVSANITDGAITPAKITSGTGSTWVWQTWAPTLGNLSGGTLTYARYNQVGKTVKLRFKYLLAGAGVSGAPTFTLPVTAHSDLSSKQTTLLADATGFVWNGITTLGSTTRADLFYWNASQNLTSISSTAPFTWATGDSLSVELQYEAA